MEWSHDGVMKGISAARGLAGPTLHGLVGFAMGLPVCKWPVTVLLCQPALGQVPALRP